MIRTHDLAVLNTATPNKVYILVGRELGETARWLWAFDAVDLATDEIVVELTTSHPLVMTTSFWRGLFEPSLERLGYHRFVRRYRLTLDAPDKFRHDYHNAVYDLTRWSDR